MRKITDYYKIQKFISFFKRKFNVIKTVETKKVYVDVGCGHNISTQFINIDYLWTPGVDVCMDISKRRLPIRNNSIKGIYTEHCLEHIPYKRVASLLKEFYEILIPGGIIRIIVPDGQIYLEGYVNYSKGLNFTLPFYEGYKTPMERVNSIFRNHGHLFIYDFKTFELLLFDAGFKEIKKQAFRKGADPVLLKDTAWREVESLYIEAKK